MSGRATKKRRAIQACAACHQRKMRCDGDGTNPCTYCTKKGYDCVYVAPKKRGPRSGALKQMKDEVETLRRRVRELEQALPDTADTNSTKVRHSQRRKRRRADSAETGTTLSLQPHPETAAALVAPICPLEQEARAVNTFFVFANPLLPMVCKESFYNAMLVLRKLDVIDLTCEGEVPCCDHSRGGVGCACLQFRPLPGGRARLRRILSMSGGQPIAKRTRTTREDLGFEADESNEGIVEFEEDGVEQLAREAAALQGHAADWQLPQNPMACAALYNAVLAVGARMAMEHESASAYARRARHAVARCFDEPSLEVVSALLCLGYFHCGTSAQGVVSRARCYITLANEMVDVLCASDPVQLGQPTRTDLALAPQNASGLLDRLHPRSTPSVSPRRMTADVLLAARFLGQLTSTPRTNPYIQVFPDLHASDGPAREGPRSRLHRILNFVTNKIRRRISTPKELQQCAPLLLEALDSAEHIAQTVEVGGRMHFCLRATIHTSRAVVLHSCGDWERALHFADQAMQAMQNDKRIYACFMTVSVFVQLIPVLYSTNQWRRIEEVLTFIHDVTRVWPVGNLLLDKARRRLNYCRSLAAAPAPSLLSDIRRATTMPEASAALHDASRGEGSLSPSPSMSPIAANPTDTDQQATSGVPPMAASPPSASSAFPAISPSPASHRGAASAVPFPSPPSHPHDYLSDLSKLAGVSTSVADELPESDDELPGFARRSTRARRGRPDFTASPDLGLGNLGTEAATIREGFGPGGTALLSHEPDVMAFERHDGELNFSADGSSSSGSPFDDLAAATASSSRFHLDAAAAGAGAGSNRRRRGNGTGGSMGGLQLPLGSLSPLSVDLDDLFDTLPSDLGARWDAELPMLDESRRHDG